MGEVVEDSSSQIPTSRAADVNNQFMDSGVHELVSVPPMQMQYNSPSLSRKPLLNPLETCPNNADNPAAKSCHNTSFFTPLGSPIRRAIQPTKIDPHDAWLPITESRNGNAYYAAFHTLCSGIGIQALVLPVSLTILGWYVYVLHLCASQIFNCIKT